MKGQARHSQYSTFRKFAIPAGFGRLRQNDFRTLLVLKTGAAQEAAAGVEWSGDFFKDDASGETGDTSPTLLVNRTKEPTIKDNSPTTNEFLFCARALSLEIDQNVTTLTETEVQEVLHMLGRCVLQIKNGQDVIFEKKAGYLLAGYPGIDLRQGALASAAANGTRGRVHPMREGDDFDDAFIVFPGGSVSARLVGEGQWTTTDDVPVTLALHGWTAAKGAVTAGAQVLGMMDLISNPTLGKAALKAA